MKLAQESKPGIFQALRFSSRGWELLQIVGAYGLLEGALWTWGRAQVPWAVALISWVMVFSLISGRSPKELGITTSGFWREFWVIPASMIVGGAMLLGGGLAGTLHGLSGSRAPALHALLYAIWALVQQFITQSFMFVRFESVLDSGNKAVWATAVLFCLAHIPNLVLMCATLVLALAWSELFRRYRNIYPLALGHALLGLTLAVSLPLASTHAMRVGIAYFR